MQAHLVDILNFELIFYLCFCHFDSNFLKRKYHSANLLYSIHFINTILCCSLQTNGVQESSFYSCFGSNQFLHFFLAFFVETMKKAVFEQCLEIVDSIHLINIPLALIPNPKLAGYPNSFYLKDQILLFLSILDFEYLNLCLFLSPSFCFFLCLQ